MGEILELDRRIKSHIMKAENLEAFANRNRGDAKKRREWERDENDTKIRKGTRIYDPALRSGTVEKVNKNTYTIMFDSGHRTTRDKSFVEVL